MTLPASPSPVRSGPLADARAAIAAPSADRLSVVWSQWRDDEPTVRQQLDPRWLTDPGAAELARRPRPQVEVDLAVDDRAPAAQLRVRAAGTAWSELTLGEHVVELEGVRLVLRVTRRRAPTAPVATPPEPTAGPLAPRPAWRRWLAPAVVVAVALLIAALA